LKAVWSSLTLIATAEGAAVPSLGWILAYWVVWREITTLTLGLERGGHDSPCKKDGRYKPNVVLGQSL